MRNQINKILRDYEKIRDIAIREQENRLLEVYSKIPVIQSIDQQISAISIEFSKMILNNEINILDRIGELEKTIKKLKQDKAIIMTENNFPHDYLEMQYICNNCNDTGFLKNGKKCNCFKQKMVDISYEMSNLHDVFKRESFDTFNIEIFTDQKFEDFKMSPRQNMRQMLAYSESFVHDFTRNDENLLFYGTTGLGKTFLCNCIAKALLDKGHTVLYQTAFKIVENLERYKFGKNRTSQDEDIYQMLFHCDLLIIDDLGTEMVNSFTNMEIFNIINSRQLMRKSTIISTNLSLSMLKEIYSDRISSRLFGGFKHLEFYGPDVRWEQY